MDLNVSRVSVYLFIFIFIFLFFLLFFYYYLFKICGQPSNKHVRAQKPWYI